MGQRISFYKNRSGKSLKELFFSTYSDFRSWYLERNKNALAEFNEAYGSEELLTYFERNEDFVADFDRLDTKLINELMVEFVSEYTYLRAPFVHILESFGSITNKWRYDESTQMVLGTKNLEFIELWNFLIYGRSLKAFSECATYTDETKIGFLAVEEQARLEYLIRHYFGDVRSTTDNYWSTTAVEEYKKAAEGPFGGRLTTYNPPTDGLDSVLSALEEIKSEQVELITEID